MTPQFTLVAGERLKSKKLIGRLFDGGLSQFYYPFKLLYLLQSNEEHKEPLQFGISIPKKKIKSAVSRNRLKRQSREAYRLNKSQLKASLESSGKKLALMFIYIEAEEKNYSVIERSIIRHLDELLKKYGNHTPDRLSQHL